MPQKIVGLAMVIFLSTNAFAVIEGTGRCRGAFLAFNYIQKENPDCDDVDIGTLCAGVVDYYLSYGHDDTSQMANDCFDFIASYQGDLYDFCGCAKDSGDDWEGCTIDECDYAVQKPYHIRFEKGEYDDYYDYVEIEEELVHSGDGKLICYNDSDDGAEGEFYVVKCACGGYGYDLSYDYSPCEESIYSFDGAVTSCMLATSDTTTFLCLPESVIEMNECEVCQCNRSYGWSSSGSGVLSRPVYFFEEMDWLSGAESEYGCQLIDNTEEYACNTGYYQTGASTCATCPSHSSGDQTSSYANTGGISACYVPAGSYSDTAGAYTFSQDCDYKN